MSIKFNYNYACLARESGFRLRQYKDGPLDWRMLGSFEIDRLLRDQSFEDIDKILIHLAEAPLGSALLDSNILDSGIAKYFIASQFAIQYLLFCRNFLDETIQELRESHTESQVEIARLKKLLNESNNEILQLNKKITQIEAIHEVIFPCHLCTKNFANNEALNIHLGRKHGGHNRITMPERKTDSPQKERTKDLTLINTIKLELEIKQLKERLNNAEKEIKSRVCGSINGAGGDGSSRRTTPREISTRNVAIQSNLSEEKEKNDAKVEEHDETNLAERQSQLAKLQEKIYDIEEWRATQVANNEESIAEINRKLKDIAFALESTAANQVQKNSELDERSNSNNLERRLSVENLERVLTEKVVQIGKASTEKLTEIVHHMETNYREKLFELELEVKRTKPTIVERTQKTKTEEISKQIVADNSKSSKSTLTKSADDEYNDNSDDEDGTYNVKMQHNEVKVTVHKADTKKPEPLQIANAESNQTCFKTKETKNGNVIKPKDNSDSTDISESLSEDEDVNCKPKEPNYNEMYPNLKNLEKPARTKATIKISNEKKVSSPKKFTRRDAKNLAAKRLESYGVSIRTKSISQSSFKRLNREMHERREKLKQTYPNFHVTRNKIKKFVDKLCSTKLPKKAAQILTKTQPMQPMKVPKTLKKSTVQHSISSDDDDDGDDLESTNGANENLDTLKKTTITAKEDFKNRLELLLASPIQKPVNIIDTPTTLKHDSQKTQELRTIPVPVPRKRVMFTTSMNNNRALNEYSD